MTESNIIVGLKTEVSRQVGFKNWEADCKDYSISCLIKSWKSCPADKVGELAWEYVDNAPFSVWKKCKSDLFGVYSKIGEYENKKGVKSQAHYTHNDKYLGSVKALGDKPVGYEGNFQIKRDKFVYDPNALTTCNNVAQLFAPKPLPVEDPEDNIPIAQLIANKKATIK